MPAPKFSALIGCLLAFGLVVPATAAGGKVRRVKVVADKAPDCSSLKTIVESVTRDCKTNDERAIAVYNFMQLTHYHQGYPGEEGGLGALKEINVYGWSLCGGLHTIEAALWRELGWDWRYVGWSDPGHTTVEARYDGRWHYLDAFLKFYAWMPDPNAPGGRTVASEDDLRANPALVTDGLEFDKDRSVYYHKGDRFEVINGKANWRAPAFLVCGDPPEGILTGLRGRSAAGSPTGWAGLEFDSPGYATDVDLDPGTALTLTWEATPGAHWWNGRQYTPGHSCGDKDYRNCPAVGPILEPYIPSGGQRRSHANGTLAVAPDFSAGRVLKGLAAHENTKWDAGTLRPVDPSRPGSITLALQSPYVMTRAAGAADGADTAEVSTDGGKTFRTVRLADFSEAVGGKYTCLVRLSFKEALRAVRIEAVVQCNRGALPYLSPGKNRVTVSVADPADLGENRLAVTYAYRPGARDRSYEDLADAGAEVARAHGATWAERPTVVRKEFTARDLPATFDVDVPTPADRYPVYPRMLFVRREVLAPGAPPAPVPGDAQATKSGAGYELKTLPDPFLTGVKPPPQRVARPTSTRTIGLRASHAVSADGRAEANHYLKWKEGETWVLLVAGDLGKLPPAREIAAARLVFPVSRGHAKAATRVGVTALAAPFENDRPFGFKRLGEVVGTAVVPVQPGGSGNDDAPPKDFAVDLTRAVKRVAAGEAPFHGLALRVVPDRSVDEGYITRLDLPGHAVLRLELETYDAN